MPDLSPRTEALAGAILIAFVLALTRYGQVLRLSLRNDAPTGAVLDHARGASHEQPPRGALRAKHRTALSATLSAFMFPCARPASLINPRAMGRWPKPTTWRITDTRTTQLYDRHGDAASLDEHGKVGT